MEKGQWDDTTESSYICYVKTEKKNKALLVHLIRHCSITNFPVNLVAMLGAYCFF